MKLSSTKTSIGIQWLTPISNGGATITSYKIYGNTGSGT